MVILLLNAGADPDTKDASQKSAIFYSIEINDFESIYALVDHGCDLSLVDENNKSPVDYAFKKKHLFLISYLFKKGGALADNTKRI
jgi:ankyrin repeat protein